MRNMAAMRAQRLQEDYARVAAAQVPYPAGSMPPLPMPLHPNPVPPRARPSIRFGTPTQSDTSLPECYTTAPAQLAAASDLVDELLDNQLPSVTPAGVTIQPYNNHEEAAEADEMVPDNGNYDDNDDDDDDFYDEDDQSEYNLD